MSQTDKVFKCWLFLEQFIIVFLVELTQRFCRWWLISLQCTLIVHVACKEFVQGCPTDWMKYFRRNHFQVFPNGYEIIFLAKWRIVFVELSLKDVCIRKWLTSIIECRENTQCSILRFCFDWKKYAVVQNTKWKIRKITWVVRKKYVNPFFKVPKIQGIFAMLSCCISIFKNEVI